MLAQNFKTAQDFGIADAELDAAIRVLGMLERGELSFAPCQTETPNGKHQRQTVKVSSASRIRR